VNSKKVSDFWQSIKVVLRNEFRAAKENRLFNHDCFVGWFVILFTTVVSDAS
jgi:hypothetical protein